MHGQAGYSVPAGKQKAWESIQTRVVKEYNVCFEHCGGDAACLDRCKEVYKVRLDREYKGLMQETGAVAPSLDIAEHASCAYCGMDRAKFAHSRMYIVYDDGSTFGACSIHCTAVDMAVKKNIPTMSFTYNDPISFYEYVYDIARLAKQRGVRILWHSNATLNRASLKELLKYTDAVTVDLKGFTEKFYR